ncbi:GNAT family N-acetyltransferase [Candidatus Woesearchaeota archaeon]|nr:GNAT family N-acetyltransferase [Candidatus Woesearchaeota archaeon]
MIQVKKLHSNRWKEYKALRLEALKKEPTSFGSSYAEETKLSEVEWKRRLKNTIFALADDKRVGMIAFIFNNKIKARHIVNIFGVYVKKEYRSQGIGKKLIDNALLLISKNKKIMKIDLCVNQKQKAAISLYKKYGFKIVGRLKKDLFVNGKFYDELLMEKFI